MLIWSKSTFERLLRFRPLIYFCVFGSEDQFKMLRICLESIDLYSEIQSDVLIVSAKEFEGHVENHLEGFSSGKLSLRVRYISASNMEDFTSARYSISDFHEFASYGPVLYLDTDIICDSEISSLLKLLRKAKGVAALSEGRLLDEREFWGRTLFIQDSAIEIDQQTRGFSTGVIGAATISEMRMPFLSVLKSIELWKVHGNAPFRVYDQPHSNYVFFKSGFHDSESLKNYVRIVGNKHDADDISRSGISHFAGGVGRNAPKLERMKTYMEKLKNSGHSKCSSR